MTLLVFVLYAVGTALFFAAVLALNTNLALVAGCIDAVAFGLSFFCKKMPETRGDW